uniref:DUF4503 domain-containing protein n=1 Tax=Denticeps clupeoides TaxID=299321 RepID=A0AAY4DUX6_9TELE
MCDSLLEALESSGSTGTLGRLVQVVVQRVYTVPFPQSSALKHRGLWTSPGTEVATSQSSSSRVCVLVQDSWGVFGEVRLQQSGSEPHPQRFQAWEGRSCVLRDVTVVQRVTRDRCVHLFSLIDSLWPPALPVTVECGAATCEESQVKVQPPSFCYRLSGREGSLLLSQGHPPSPLYQPAVLQSLAEILQAERRGVCCSFIAAVVFVQLQDSDAGDRESWLFVTDASLQGASGGRGSCSRCVAVCLRPSCSLQDSVRQAIGSSSPPSSSSACWLRFKDAVLQQGGVVCLEQTVVSPEPAGPSGPLPRPLVLDPLSPDTPPNTLCSLSGVVLGVEEDSAYSWPVCSVCESERLEIAPDKTSAFVCTACGVVVEKPTVKLHLEVFLSCPTLGPQATVKVKVRSHVRGRQLWKRRGHR